MAKLMNLIKTCGGGFTLLEMIVAISLFITLILAATGITLGVSRAQLKTASVQAMLDNIRFSLELITKELRTGSGYTLSSFGIPCGGVPGAEISFDTALDEKRVYYLQSGSSAIMRIKNSTDCSAALPLTSSEVVVESFAFRLQGQASGPNDGQPVATLSLRVRASDPRFGPQTNMELQTTVVQRLRDL